MGREKGSGGRAAQAALFDVVDLPCSRLVLVSGPLRGTSREWGGELHSLFALQFGAEALRSARACSLTAQPSHHKKSCSRFARFALNMCELCVRVCVVCGLPGFGQDREISFSPLISTMLLAEGGVRKSFNAGFWRARLATCRPLMVRKGPRFSFARHGGDVNACVSR